MVTTVRRRAATWSLAVLGAVASAGPGLLAGPAAAATSSQLPSHASTVTAMNRAVNYYQPAYATSASFPPRNGWSWSTYHQGVLSLAASTGDYSRLRNVVAWGNQNAWGITTDSHEVNPDSMKAAHVYVAASKLDPAASRTKVDAKMASDLTALPNDQYDWVDALFMGLSNWADAYARTGNPAYLTKLDALFTYTRDQAATSDRCTSSPSRTGGLWSAADGLWYRDCNYVGTLDPNGRKVFWSRGNGWAIAAMADTLAALPAGDPRAATYADVLVRMAAALAPLQGTDGLWRSSLLDPALFPSPETSGTALITYALAYGIRTGRLDAATYRPVVARAWTGMTTYSLQPNGFLRGCQRIAGAPGVSFTGTAPTTAPTATSPGSLPTDSPPYCVGAFVMAGSEVAQLSADLARGSLVTATAQSAGYEVRRLVDGNNSTFWSATGFPQTARIDLRATRTISNTMLATYLDRAYRYRIDTSLDGTTWTRRVDRTANTSPGTLVDTFAAGPVSARYVRLTVTGVAGSTTTRVSLVGFGVYA
ncbi:MAG: hypothetical protein JWL64_1271 [Frankiales bacterium]|nr:hypothetical protein [Frankiales bacterium]